MSHAAYWDRPFHVHTGYTMCQGWLPPVELLGFEFRTALTINRPTSNCTTNNVTPTGSTGSGVVSWCTIAKTDFEQSQSRTCPI